MSSFYKEGIVMEKPNQVEIEATKQVIMDARVEAIKEHANLQTLTKKDCVKNAMNIMGWGLQPLPQSKRWEEPSTGCPAADLQSAFDWHEANHGGFFHWENVFKDLKEFSERHVKMDTFSTSKGPSSYHSVCLFRVVGFMELINRGGLTEYKECDEPKHFVGIKRGDKWLWKDAEGRMMPFKHEPVVDAWAYLD